MRVIKIGGGCLTDTKTIARVIERISVFGRGHVVVFSALNGVTDYLIQSAQTALEDTSSIPETIETLYDRHYKVIRPLNPSARLRGLLRKSLALQLEQAERVLVGLSLTQEITPRLYDLLLSLGEKLAAITMAHAIQAAGTKSTVMFPETLGMETDGVFGEAQIRMKEAEARLKQTLFPRLRRNVVVVVPGFYGISPGGQITTFGRGGSDYSAAVIAAALHAEELVLWKDVAGFMTADPRWVSSAQIIPELSHDEAAELCYYGAKIMHPMTVEPIRGKRIPISIRSVDCPDIVGSLVGSRKTDAAPTIKSVACDMDVAMLKAYGAGSGARHGLLSAVTGALTDKAITIKAVLTAPTCYSILLSKADLDEARRTLGALKPRPYRRLRKVGDLALVSIVGDQIGRRKGIPAKFFSALANAGVRVELISFGPSDVALSVVLKAALVDKAIHAIHAAFFAGSQDSQ